MLVSLCNWNFKCFNHVILDLRKSDGSPKDMVFIYGENGVGKTHLGQAVGLEVIKPTQELQDMTSELIFDDMPFSKWRGKVSDEVIYMPEHGGHKAVMEASFRAEPFCKCIFDTEGPALEMPFMLGANIPVDISCLFKFNISGSVI